jgi:hypothetical protein
MRSGGFKDLQGRQAPALDSEDRTGMGKRRIPGDLESGAFKTGRGAGFVLPGIIFCHDYIVEFNGFHCQTYFMVEVDYEGFSFRFSEH